MFHTNGKWKLILAYYACYSALYSLLMKCRIKSEIHDCSLELISLFDFSVSEVNFFRKLKEKRIKTQYYLQGIILKDEIVVKKFIIKCKILLNSLNLDKINKIRDKIKK